LDRIGIQVMRLKQKRSFSAGVNKGSRREIVKRKAYNYLFSAAPSLAAVFLVNCAQAMNSKIHIALDKTSFPDLITPSIELKKQKRGTAFRLIPLS